MPITLPNWTQRDDLAVLKWTRPSLPGTRFLPTLTVTKKSDVIVYMPVRDDSLTAQTGRGMSGVFDIDNLDNVRKPIDLTSAEIASTQGKDISDIVEMGDLENSMRQMAMNGKPVVMYKLETAIAKELLDHPSALVTSTDMANFIKVVREQRAAISAKLGDGKLGIGMSQATFNKLVVADEIKAQMGKNVSMPYTQDLTVANLQRIQLAAIFGVDEVLIGQNVAWYSDTITNKDAIVIALLPEPGMDPRYVPQLGRTACFVTYVAEPTPADAGAGQDDYDAAIAVAGPGGNKRYSTPFVCSAWTNSARGQVALTTQSFAQPIVMNPGLMSVVSLPAEASASV